MTRLKRFAKWSNSAQTPRDETKQCLTGLTGLESDGSAKEWVQNVHANLILETHEIKHGFASTIIYKTYPALFLGVALQQFM